ncbi:3'(2'),5'-bisphosphate nucleotidase CysQ [Iodidimonas sp. SYSU 1G8]|uniref:inositol monophosphatase family protein n=1 Tax=Iodidimonas sp. SYSU 1G8 TaxID=3133967 RepID=UPI0031FE7B83
MPEIDLSHRRQVLVEAVRDAGALAMDYFRDGFRKWEKAADDPVTEADLAVDALLRDRLLGALPGDGWLSEESERAPHAVDQPFTWVVDPIDGTRAFIEQKPHFTICAALVHGDRTVLGAVFNPATDEFFEASLGGGALCNGQPISVSDKQGLDGVRMIGYRAMFDDRHWRTPWPPVKIHMVNSIAYRVVLVARGDHDACINLKPQNDWDIAAAELILREAGGLCTNRNGEPYRFHGKGGMNQNVIAANPVLQAKLVAKLREFEPQMPKKD